ncbi:MAG: protein jag [Oscillospiraceae bacterium]|jgi:spoIIIJ-associated protein|nr:protein jag [Oscillospiraceae bacterium]
MEKTVTKTAKSVEEAISLAIEELGVAEEDAVIEVVEDGSSKGFLGIGKKSATVRVTADVSETDESDVEEEDTTYYGDDESFEGDAISEAEEEAVNFVAEILSGIGIHGKLDSYREEDTVFISVTGQDCGAAIGRHGETLDAISYLTSLVANKNSEEHIRVSLDIGGYKKRREEIVISLAKKAAARVLHTGSPISMEAMNPSERRIVHFALQSFGGVSTHSEGEEPERRVIVSPAGKEQTEV